MGFYDALNRNSQREQFCMNAYPTRVDYGNQPARELVPIVEGWTGNHKIQVFSEKFPDGSGEAKHRMNWRMARFTIYRCSYPKPEFFGVGIVFFNHIKKHFTRKDEIQRLRQTDFEMSGQ